MRRVKRRRIHYFREQLGCPTNSTILLLLLLMSYKITLSYPNFPIYSRFISAFSPIFFFFFFFFWGGGGGGGKKYLAGKFCVQDYFRVRSSFPGLPLLLFPSRWLSCQTFSFSLKQKTKNKKKNTK